MCYLLTSRYRCFWKEELLPRNTWITRIDVLQGYWSRKVHCWCRQCRHHSLVTAHPERDLSLNKLIQLMEEETNLSFRTSSGTGPYGNRCLVNPGSCNICTRCPAIYFPHWHRWLAIRLRGKRKSTYNWSTWYRYFRCPLWSTQVVRWKLSTSNYDT
jgi:hypothetical protein